MVSPTSRSTSSRAGDQKQRTQPRYMDQTESSRAKQVDRQPTVVTKRSAPKKNPSATPQCAVKASASKPTVSPRASAKTHASEDVATKKAERPTNEAPGSTTETPTPGNEWYSAPTCSPWSFPECSPAHTPSGSPPPTYDEAYIHAPVYDRQESSATRSSLLWSALGVWLEPFAESSPKALTKPKSNFTANIDVPLEQKDNSQNEPDDLACQILGDIDIIMQPIGIDIYDI
ncbi:hypothetical protein ACGC1H_007438 [Rhizoctonia solani]